MHALPLVTLHLTERCNSRCVTCDYWRHGRRDVTRESVAQLLPQLEALGTELAMISGGEPLIHPDWIAICEAFRARDIELWLVTSGLSLAKHAAPVARLFKAITVSLDGIDREMYAAIRGLDAFDKVCEGIRAAATLGVPTSVRVTVQRSNYHALPEFVTLARSLGAAEISFLPVDVSNLHAFGRTENFAADVALHTDDLPKFEATLARLECDHASDFTDRFIAESPHKLRRLRDYFAAIRGERAFPQTRCNAPEFSAVIDIDARVKPCFFIDPPTQVSASPIETALNDAAMQSLRADIRAGARAECVTCVCPLWRDESERDRATLGALRAPRSVVEQRV
jgi:MoaA/NifB/PqqE/SkfB family radical SAM enzyme